MNSQAVKNRERVAGRPQLTKKGKSLVEKTRQLKNIAKAEGFNHFFELTKEKQVLYLKQLS